MNLSVRTAARSLLWATYLGALSVLVCALLVSWILGPLVAPFLTPPVSPIWNPLLAEVAMSLGGGLLVLGVGWLVEIPPGVAAGGVGGVGGLVLALLTALSSGLHALWGSPLALLVRLGAAILTGGIAYAAAVWTARRRERVSAAPGPAAPR